MFRSFAREFQEFALRGNVLELAIGVIIGAAFQKIVTSLVNDIITPVIGVLLGGLDFKALSLHIGSATIMYGSFIQNVIDFVIVALVIFISIKGINRLTRREVIRTEELKK